MTENGQRSACEYPPNGPSQCQVVRSTIYSSPEPDRPHSVKMSAELQLRNFLLLDNAFRLFTIDQMPLIAVDKFIKACVSKTAVGR